MNAAHAVRQRESACGIKANKIAYNPVVIAPKQNAAVIAAPDDIPQTLRRTTNGCIIGAL